MVLLLLRFLAVSSLGRRPLGRTRSGSTYEITDRIAAAIRRSGVTWDLDTPRSHQGCCLLCVGSSFGTPLVTRINLNRALKMFFGKLFHPEVLQPETDHPMVKRIVRSELVGLSFVSDCFFESAERSLSARELIVGQNEARIALHRIAPNGNGFLLAA